MRRVVVLCGGFGAARFLDGLRRIPDVALTCIANTADDLEYTGVHISPDVDTVSYALAGLFDEVRGFGLIDDSFRNAEALRRYGLGWFGVGDVDLAHCCAAPTCYGPARRCSRPTADLTRGLGLTATVLPMSDDPVRMKVVTDEGRLAFQDYLVARRAQPKVLSVGHDRVASAQPAPGVIPAPSAADLVILAPAAPSPGLAPILALPGVRSAVASARSVAITPVVSGVPPTTPPEQSRFHVRAAFMESAGLTHTTATIVARLYADCVNAFVVDERDASERPAIEQLGLAVTTADTLATGSGRVDLAQLVLILA